MSGEDGVLDGDVSAVADVDKTTVRGTLIALTGDAMFQAIHDNVGTPDRDVAAVVGILRWRSICDGGEPPASDCQRLFVDRERGHLGDLIEVPDDGCIWIHVAVFINGKNIGLWRPIVLVQPVADVALGMGIGDGDEAGAW